MFPARLSLAGLLLATTLHAAPPVLETAGGRPVVAGAVSGTFQVPVGKALVVPLAASDADGDVLSYSVAAGSDALKVQVRNANPIMRVTATYNTVSGTSVLAGSGTMDAVLFRDFTPLTAGYIGGFAAAGFYDGLKFHRVLEGFVLQGGDPLGNGTGGPVFQFDNEFAAPLIFTGTAQLAMANSGFQNGAATNGSQFFITLDDTRFLDFNHTIFGQVVRGFDTVDEIAVTPVNSPLTGSPVSPVVMTDVALLPTYTDAVALIAATGTGVANVVVTVSDGVAQVSGTLVVQSEVDAVNDPPFVVPTADVVGTGSTATVRARAVDLESDFLQWGFTLTGGSTNALAASKGGGRFKLSAQPATYRGPVPAAIRVRQFGSTARGSSTATNGYDLDPLVVGLGDKTIVARPVRFSGTVGETVGGVVAEFTDNDRAGVAGNFTAQINWGDNTASAGVITPTGGNRPGFAVSGSHSYAAPGLYPVVVTIQGNLGARAEARGTVQIFAGGMRGLGAGIRAKNGKVKNVVVGRFQDAAPLAPDGYAATILWGDGSVGAGSVEADGAGFAVRGSHVYRNDGRYTTCVRLVRGGGPDEIALWGTAEATGIGGEPLPPFTIRRLFGGWAALAHTRPKDTSRIVGSFVLINSGGKTVKGAKLRFFLSDDSTLSDGDTRLTHGNGLTELLMPDLSPGGSVSVPIQDLGPGIDLRLVVPGNINATAKRIIAVPVYKDKMVKFLPSATEFVATVPAP